MITNDKICRPKGIVCDTVWELYKLLQGSEMRYMWYCPGSQEKLCLIDRADLTEGEVVYAHYPQGDLPCLKDEGVRIILSDIENGEKKWFYSKIKVNALFSCEETPEGLLKNSRLRFASGADIQNTEFEETEKYYNGSKLGIPVNDYTVHIIKDEKPNKTKESEAFYRSLQRYNKACKTDHDNGCPRVDLVIMSDTVPGEFVQGRVCFYNCIADVRVSYNSIGADICRKSEYKAELYRLLNYINAYTVAVVNPKGYLMTYTPRIFMNEADGCIITVSAAVGYDSWRSRRSMTDLFISEYLPKLLEFLSPYIFGVLKGEMTAEDAILE